MPLSGRPDAGFFDHVRPVGDLRSHDGFELLRCSAGGIGPNLGEVLPALSACGRIFHGNLWSRDFDLRILMVETLFEVTETQERLQNCGQ
jgi:hypothetical protein